jgi:hypothetical protein
VLSFEVRSNAVVLYFISHTNGAAVDVCVDAVCDTFATAGSDARVSLLLDELADGVKEITIQKSASDATALRIDAIYVYPYYSVEATPEADYTIESAHTYNGQDFTAALDLRLTAGDAAIIGLLFILALLVGVSITLQVISHE